MTVAIRMLFSKRMLTCFMLIVMTIGSLVLFGVIKIPANDPIFDSLSAAVAEFIHPGGGSAADLSPVPPDISPDQFAAEMNKLKRDQARLREATKKSMIIFEKRLNEQARELKGVAAGKPAGNGTRIKQYAETSKSGSSEGPAESLKASIEASDATIPVVEAGQEITASQAVEQSAQQSEQTASPPPADTAKLEAKQIVFKPAAETDTAEQANPPAAEQQQTRLSLFWIEQELAAHTNAARIAAGLFPLYLDQSLVESARKHSAWMAKGGGMTHSNDRVAENIAAGQRSGQEVLKTWMNSPGHRANILGQGYTRLGVAAYVSASGTIFWTQQFR
jgi:uncharacterized protein YkwD